MKLGSMSSIAVEETGEAGAADGTGQSRSPSPYGRPDAGRRDALAALLAVAAAAATATGARPAMAQVAGTSRYPDRPVRIVVPFPPGGSTDITARIIAAWLAEHWKQTVLVENRPGAAANIGTEAVARAAPDGTVMLLGTTALPISAATFSKLAYDPVKDLRPVLLVSTIANVLVVNPALPAGTIGEFIAYARAHPGKLNYASPGAATGQRMTFELIKQSTGVDIVHVPYKGGAPAGQAVVAGEVESMIMNVVEAQPLVKAGRLRALAVTTRKRSALMPEVPTIDETVVPGIDTAVWQGVFLPAGTPDTLVLAIADAWRLALEQPAIHQRLSEMGMQVIAGTPEAFERFLAAEFAQWARVARTGNIRAE